MLKRSNDSDLPSAKKPSFDELPDENGTYAASGLKKSLHGVAYQLQLLIIIAERCHVKNHSFLLATEIDAAGKHDDLVLWHKKDDPNDKIANTLFLQAKHSQPTEDGQTLKEIEYRDLVSKNPKNQFSLIKYFKSFLTIERQLSSNGKFYIFTNKNFKFDQSCEYAHLKKLGSFYFELVHEKEDLLNFEQGCHYRLVNSPVSNETTPNKKTLEEQLQHVFGGNEDIKEIKKFCERLVFAVNQPSETDLSEIAKKELKINFNLSDVDFVADSFLVTIFNWFKEKVGTYLSKRKIDELFKEIRKKLAQLVVTGITTDYTKELEGYHIEFIQDELFVKIEKFLKEEQYSILKIQTNETSVQLCSIKVDQILNQKFKKQNKAQGKIVFASLSSLVRQSDTVIEAFSNESTELLVIVDDNKELNRDITSFYEDLNQIIKKDIKKLKKIILISIESDNLTGFNGIMKETKHEIEYKDLTEASKNKLLEKKVKFLGKDIILNKLLTVKSPTTQYLPLNKIIQGHHIEIGTPPPESSGYNKLYFFERTFFVYNSQISGKVKISYTPEKFDDFMKGMESHEVIMISDSAGTGKSTVLTHLFKKMQQKFENYWVVRIDLNNHTETLEACLKKQINVENLLINEFLFLKSELEKQLFKQFLQEKRVITMLDGFDEISPHYEEVVINIIEQLKETSQLWVATRPHLKAELEKKFGIQSCNLRPFSRTEQHNFLSKFWNRNDTSSGNERVDRQKRANIFIEALIKHLSRLSYERKDFLGIPLHLMMIAEIFKDEFEKFIKSSDKTVSFHENLSLFDLYDKFINRKFDIFLGDKRKARLSNLSVKEARNREFAVFNKQHQYLALHLLLSSKDAKYLAKITKLNTDINEQEIIRIGIVKKIVNGVPEFLHRTFAEFYFASFLIENLHIDCIKKLLLEKILKDWEFKVVRKFINSNFAKKLPEQNVINPLRKPVTKKDEDNIKAILERNVNEENAVILHYLLESIKQAKLYIDLRPMLDMAIDKNIKNLTSNYCFDTVIIMLKFYDKDDLNDLDDTTALFLAIKNNHLDQLDTLLQRVANINASNYYYDTPFTFAAGIGRTKVVDKLLQKRADVNAVNNFAETPLHLAAEHGHIDIVIKLLENGAIVNAVDNFNKETPLHVAAEHGHTVIVQMLLDKKADVKAVNSHKETPLHLAAQHGHIDIVQMLLKNGANVNAKKYYNETPLHLAAERGHIDIVIKLLENGAIVNAVDNFNKETPLHVAAEHGHTGIVQILLDKGANVNAVNKAEKTPLFLATKNGHTQIVEILKNGADRNVLNDQG